MELARQLSYNYLFRGLARETIAGIAAMSTVRRYYGGDTLVRQFERSDDLFVLLEGNAKIKDFRGEIIAEFGPGSIVGEVSLLDDDTRSATVVAAGPLVAAVIPSYAIKGLMESDPEIKSAVMANLGRVLCRKLRTANERLSERVAVR